MRYLLKTVTSLWSPTTSTGGRSYDKTPTFSAGPAPHRRFKGRDSLEDELTTHNLKDDEPFRARHDFDSRANCEAVRLEDRHDSMVNKIGATQNGIFVQHEIGVTGRRY